MTTSLNCSNWKLRLSFLGIVPGKGNDVYNFLSGQPCGTHTPCYLKCFGYPDIVELCPLESAETPLNRYFGSDILRTIYIDAIPVPANGKTAEVMELQEWLRTAPYLILVIIKLNPSLTHVTSLQGELAAAMHIYHRIGEQKCRVFLTLSHSELILIARGNNFSVTLTEIAKVRKAIVKDLSEIATKENELPLRAGENIFLKTETFPLVSYPLVIIGENYDRLVGQVDPVVQISCCPTEENDILESLPDSWKANAGSVWGRPDVIARVGNNPLAEFTKALIDLRQGLTVKGVQIYSSSTFFITRPEEEIKAAGLSKSKETCDTRNGILLQKIRELVDSDALSHLNDNIKTQILEFLMKARDCAADYYVGADYDDMMGFVQYLTWGVKATAKLPIGPGKIHHESLLSDITEIATNALYHRTAGTEGHLQGFIEPLDAPIVGANRVVAAMGNVPRFIFDDILTKHREKDERVGRWLGFTAFGSNYTFGHAPGEIITYPSYSLYKPFQEWHVVTHEIAHALYDILDVDKTLADAANSDFKRPIEKAIAKYGTEQVNDQSREIFAQWFDFRYFFNGDINFYLRAIWSTWMMVPEVNKSKVDYAGRTMLIWLSQERFTERLRKMRGDTVDREFVKVLKCLRKLNEGFQPFYDELITADSIGRVNPSVMDFKYLPQIFERSYIKDDLLKQINATYKEIESHENLIWEGKAFTERIPNPQQLLFRLVRRYFREGPESQTLARVTALILTFANDYRERLHATTNGAR